MTSRTELSYHTKYMFEHEFVNEPSRSQAYIEQNWSRADKNFVNLIVKN